MQDPVASTRQRVTGPVVSTPRGKQRLPFKILDRSTGRLKAGATPGRPSGHEATKETQPSFVPSASSWPALESVDK
jgi:hypothetical protein